MLIRLYKYTFKTDDKFENPKFLAAYREENFDKLVNLLESMKEHGIKVGEQWYTIDDYIFTFPEDHESIPAIDIYCFDDYESY